MRITKILSNVGGKKTSQLLLPPPTFWETGGAALKGAWSHVVDQSARDAYEELVEKGVIKDTVLQNATAGSTLTFALFNNLKNPLFKKYSFDPVEFVTVVGPALENFHDVLSRLRNSLQEDLEKEKLQEQTKGTPDDSLSNNVTYKDVVLALGGENNWREQAKKDENGLAGQLTKMTTDACLDAFFYTSKLDILSRATVDTPIGIADYIPGSCNVNEVALLSARVMELDTSEEPFPEHEEFRVSEQNQKDMDVAAQINVLYEVSQSYKTKDIPVDTAVANAVDSKNVESVNQLEVQKVSAASAADEGTISYTNLAVAVFEGWLHRRGDRESLRWKIAMLREAFEFPHHQPVVTHKPSK